MNNRDTYVYIANSGPKSTKIGISRRPNKRVSGLSTANPGGVKLHRTHGPFRERDARAIERGCHRALQEFCITGEWFSVCPETANEMVEIMQNADHKTLSNPDALDLAAYVFCVFVAGNPHFKTEYRNMAAE